MKLFALTLTFLCLIILAEVVPQTMELSETQEFPPRFVELIGTTDDNLLPILSRYDTLVIKRGNGGKVYGMLDVVAFLKGHPRKRVIIDGSCYSACTLLLNAPRNVWLTQNARMFFHSAVHDECVDGIIQKRMTARGNHDMWKSFKRKTREWILRTQAYGSTNFTAMPFAFMSEAYPSMMITVAEPMDVSALVQVDANTVESKVKSKPRACPFTITPLP